MRHAHPAARLPLVWRAGDPEPDNRVTHVSTGPHWFDQWHRVRPPREAPDYRWHNGDKIRTWDMLTHNRGPVFNTARLRHTRTLKRQRRGRHGRRPHR